MAVLPSGLTQSIVGFSDLFSTRTWPLAQMLQAGTILVVGPRTVAAVQRVMGMAEVRFCAGAVRALLPGPQTPPQQARRPYSAITMMVKRWLPEWSIVVVADSSFAALNLLAAVREQLCVVTRLRLDAAVYDPAPARAPDSAL